MSVLIRMEHIIKEESETCKVYMKLIVDFIEDGLSQSSLEYPETAGLLLFLKEKIKTGKLIVKEVLQYGIIAINKKQERLYICFFHQTDNKILENIITHTHKYISQSLSLRKFAIELNYSSYKIIEIT